LEKVIYSHPRSNFAGYANFALGVNLAKDFTNFKEKRLRKANLEAASEYLEKARSVYFSFHQSAYSHIYLDEIYRKMGLPGKADDVRKDLLTKAAKVMANSYYDFWEYKDFMMDYLERRKAIKEK
jgi:outer membrane protein assembly factor BamD (BamD/ComL family)